MSERRHITFRVGDHRFAVPIEKVREVLGEASVITIPGGRKPLEGVIPYRDHTLLPVFSLLELLGERAEAKTDLIIVAGLEGSPVGFRVDKMGGIVTLSDEDEVDPYDGGLEPQEGVISGVLKNPEGDYILIDIDQVLGS